MHFGIISPPVPGHLNPFAALGRELIDRGHRVTVFHMADLADRMRSEGLEFVTIGETDHPAGSLPISLAQLARLDGMAALKFTVEAIRKTTQMFGRDVPAAIERTGIDALLVDQTEPIGGAVAEHLKLPFITICNALVLSRDSEVPPPFTSWDYKRGSWPRLRNWAGYTASRRVTRPVFDLVNRFRRDWGLAKLRDAAESFSELAQISQQPAAFDFPRTNLPQSFHYVGPLRHASPRTIPFPWDKLDGRPLIYASLGTLQNRKEALFRQFAEACKDLNVQLVITHGGGLPESVTSTFPGNPLVVSYAPQLAVLSKASLTLTHAGLNTVLDSLTHGVPLVAVPITYEQPAIASRIRWAKVGEVLALQKVNPKRLRHFIEKTLSNMSYALAAQGVKRSIAEGGGANKAATIIEKVLSR